VAELERTLTVSEIVLRHMVKRRDPKAVQKEREEREEREARAAAAAAAAAETAHAEAATAPEVTETQEEVPATPVEETSAELVDAPAAVEEESVEANS